MTFLHTVLSTLRVRFLLFPLLLAVALNPVDVHADVIPDSVDIRLVPDTGTSNLLIQIKVHSSAPFGGILSAVTITVRYDASSGMALGAGTSFCPAWSAFSPSPVVVNDGIAYRTYNGFGTIRLEDSEFDGGCGLSLPVETWFTISTIPVGGSGCTAFTMGNDAFTHAENRDFYISMAGQDVTGQVIGGPLNAGNCPADCMGVPGGSALPGTACDDGDANTINDVWGADCVCAGTAYDCPDLQANIGDACDDGNAGTVDDVVNADCVCAGTVVYDCPDLQANIGDACDDGNAATTMDSVTVECTCEGVLTSGIVDPASARTFLALQPNPSRDGLVLLKVDGLPREVVQATIVVRDAQGRTLLHTSSTVMAGALRYRLDLSARAAEGLYMVEVVAGDQHYLGRLVIQ